MYQGKSPRKKKPNKRNSLVIALVLAVLLVAAVGTTIAYINHSSNQVKNDFSPSEITCQIDEKVDGGVKSSVKVKNTGKTAAYIRAAVIANTVDDEGNINGAADVSGYLCGDGWVKSGDYYYYTIPVAPNEGTGELLTESINLEGIQVTILAEAIQSQPASAAQDAWGVSPASLSSN
ncbi:MAG: hypothetical protein KBS74_04710 [Clostridiales bacterium]|nr:hypothetical protein [Candidatus Cacconaster stercorequi]